MASAKKSLATICTVPGIHPAILPALQGQQGVFAVAHVLSLSCGMNHKWSQTALCICICYLHPRLANFDVCKQVQTCQGHRYYCKCLLRSPHMSFSLWLIRDSRVTSPQSTGLMRERLSLLSNLCALAQPCRRLPQANRLHVFTVVYELAAVL